MAWYVSCRSRERGDEDIVLYHGILYEGGLWELRPSSVHFTVIEVDADAKESPGPRTWLAGNLSFPHYPALWVRNAGRQVGIIDPTFILSLEVHGALRMGGALVSHSHRY